jgi:1,4-dihydroxy-2-naphthoyl-CoA synthase
MVMNSPTVIACCKAALNAYEDGGAGILQMGGQVTRFFYKSSESQEGQVSVETGSPISNQVERLDEQARMGTCNPQY